MATTAIAGPTISAPRTIPVAAGCSAGGRTTKQLATFAASFNLAPPSLRRAEASHTLSALPLLFRWRRAVRLVVGPPSSWRHSQLASTWRRHRYGEQRHRAPFQRSPYYRRSPFG